MVDLKLGRAFKTPVTLADIKADERLENLALIRQGRLSVVPIDAKSWKIICGMGGVKP
jgi:predicted RNA-binding protein with PUA-like domain